MRFCFFLLISSLLSSVGLAATNDGWEFAGETDSVRVYTRPHEGGNIREVKAQSEIDATSERVLKVIGDYDHFKDFMPYTRESREIKREGDDTYFYTYLTPPIVHNRDYTIKLTKQLVDSRPGYYKVSWQPANDQGPPPRAKTVRVEIDTGYWLLEPAAEGKKTLVTYYLYTNPGGAIPTWLANKANRDTLPNIIKAVKNRIKDKQYD